MIRSYSNKIRGFAPSCEETPLPKLVDPSTSAPIEVAEAKHFYRCARCGVWVDCRDLGMVFEHEGGLPQPVGNKPH